MKITFFSLFLLGLVCFAIWRSILKLKHKSFGIGSAILWISVWALIGIGSIFPELISYLMTFTDAKFRVVFVLLIGVVILYGIVFSLTIRLEKTQRDTRRLIQEISLIKYNYDENKKFNDNK